MGKGLAVVLFVSLTTIIMFCVMMYLMSTINPTDIYSDKDKKVVQTPNIPSESNDESVRRSGIYFDDDTAVLPIVDTVQYGLDKIDTIMLDLYRSTEQPELIYQSKDRKVIPPLWPRAAQNIIVNPSIQKLLPPIWPTTSEKENLLISGTTRPEQPVNTTNEETIETAELNAKPVKRRSVNNYVVDEDESSVILKILDNNGESKIEIRVWSDIFLHLSEQSPDAIQLSQKKFKYTLTSDIDLDNGTAETSKHTVVKFSVNDSVVNEELVVSPRNESENNVKKSLAASVLNTTYSGQNSSAEMLPLNKTENVESSLSKSSDYGQIGNNNMSILKHARSDDSNTNITDSNHLLNILFNTNNNNTEFIKGIFAEGSNNDAQVNTTSDHTPGNNKTLVTDTYPNNLTDLVKIEHVSLD